MLKKEQLIRPIILEYESKEISKIEYVKKLVCNLDGPILRWHAIRTHQYFNAKVQDSILIHKQGLII